MPADQQTTDPQTTGPPLRVSTLELFFDLVFAFTLTQLSALLDDNGFSATSIVQVLLVFGVLWWMYGGYAWLTNTRTPDRPPERLLLLVGMAGFLVVGLAIRNGFGHSRSASSGIFLGLGYLVVVCVHGGLYYRVNRNIVRVLPVNLGLGTAGPGGRADHRPGRLPAVDGGAGHPGAVPAGGAGRRPVRDRPGAFRRAARRAGHRGAGRVGRRGRHRRRRAPAGPGRSCWPPCSAWPCRPRCGGSTSAARTTSGPAQAMAEAPRERRPALALSAYFYPHIPILLGVVALAAGVKTDHRPRAVPPGRPGAGHRRRRGPVPGRAGRVPPGAAPRHLVAAAGRRAVRPGHGGARGHREHRGTAAGAAGRAGRAARPGTPLGGREPAG